MSLKCGIVGLPNVGKSTLFNALTKAGIAAENYPFCTIEPNVGVVEVPDPRLGQLAGKGRCEIGILRHPLCPFDDGDAVRQDALLGLGKEAVDAERCQTDKDHQPEEDHEDGL